MMTLSQLDLDTIRAALEAHIDLKLNGEIELSAHACSITRALRRWAAEAIPGRHDFSGLEAMEMSSALNSYIYWLAKDIPEEIPPMCHDAGDLSRRFEQSCG